MRSPVRSTQSYPTLGVDWHGILSHLPRRAIESRAIALQIAQANATIPTPYFCGVEFLRYWGGDYNRGKYSEYGQRRQ